MPRKKSSRKTGRYSKPKTGGARRRSRQKKQERRGGLFDFKNEDIEFFTPKKGVNVFDILPYEVSSNVNPFADKGELWYERTIFVHYNIGAEESSYLCLKTVGKKCPICEYRAQLFKSKDDSDKQQVQALRPSERQLFNVYDPEDDEYKILYLAHGNFGKVLDEEINEDEDEQYNFFFWPEDGYRLKVRFSKESFDKGSYLKASRIDFRDRDPYPESVVDELEDLDACLNVLSYEKLERIFLELDEDEEASGEAEYPDDDDDEDERDQDHEIEKEDEPEPPPRKKSTRSKKAPVKKKAPKKKPSNSCPSGYNFGADCDEYDECDDCDVWEACMDEKDRLEDEE